jgi:hypothetical protein
VHPQSSRPRQSGGIPGQASSVFLGIETHSRDSNGMSTEPQRRVGSDQRDVLVAERAEFHAFVKNLAVGICGAQPAAGIDRHFDRGVVTDPTVRAQDSILQPRQKVPRPARKRAIAAVLLRVEFFDDSQRHNEASLRPAQDLRPVDVVGAAGNARGCLYRGPQAHYPTRGPSGPQDRW